MGDGQVSKYALIINGSTESRHLRNVDDSLRVLGDKGYETYVVSPEEPQRSYDNYSTPTLNNIRQQIEQISGRIDDDDDLVIYVTGHGSEDYGEGGICLSGEGDCDSYTFNHLLDMRRYGQRTVIMNQCYSGNWSNIFLDDPRTLFIANGSSGEITYDEFTPSFWGNVRDRNDDGAISWQERYANASPHVDRSSPMFVASEGYVEEGTPPFQAAVREVGTVRDLTDALDDLRPGQYAIVNFSMNGYEVCRQYEPVFNRTAEDSQGQYLFLQTRDEDVAEEFDVYSFPTVMVIDDKGKRYTIRDQENIVAGVVESVQGSSFERYSLQLEEVLEAVRQNGRALENMPEEFRGDREVVLAAASRFGEALQFATDELRNDRSFILEVVRQNPYSIEYVSPELAHDREIVLEAVRQDGFVLTHASREFRSDREIVLAAVRQNWMMLMHASDELKGDRDIVLEAVRQNGLALRYASDALKNDREVVLAAVRQWGGALQFASRELKGDRATVLEAVRQNGRALRYASDELKGDREIVLAAIRQWDGAIDYASSELQRDPEILRASGRTR